MRQFIITEDGQSRLLAATTHPCDDQPPIIVVPARLDYTGAVIAPAVINDPVPLYDGPRENVVEVKDNAAGAKLMQEFHGHAALRKERPELFRAPVVSSTPGQAQVTERGQKPRS